MQSICALALFVTVASAAPIDEPIRVELPVYNEPQLKASTTEDSWYARENHPGENVNNNDYSDLNKFHFHSLSDNSLGIFAPPVTTRETVLLESEGLGSKVLSFKEGLQSTAAGIFQPKPIVDTIREEEKYGNTGDKFYSTGQSLVRGASSLSTFVNGLLEVPGNLFKQVARTATEKLNQLGGRLVGL